MEKEIERYNKWRRFALEDSDLMVELEGMEEDAQLIKECFYKDLEFGTGGLRGVIGAGSSRMNIYTVRRATQGLAEYLLADNSCASVAIAYDSRIKSELFAKNAAMVLAGNGIQVFIYQELMPTPALSFAVRHHKCSAGICITASHNPAKYNGYKVYGHDGCQITLEAAEEIIEKISFIDTFEDISIIEYDSGLQSGKIAVIHRDTVDAYLKAVKEQSLQPITAPLHVVYTPLNGAGRRCVLSILNEIHVSEITIVKEQEMPDGRFPTCPYPNPEKKEALEEGLKLSNEVRADLLLATDPDCDRVGIAVRHEGDYILLSGNETGVLLFDYICRIRKECDRMPEHAIAVKTIVTTDMAEKIAFKYGVTLIQTLTGFKFIGEQIGKLEEMGQEDKYIFGFEESYGYLSGPHVRDKDAVNASMLICEMASYYKNKGITLVEQLNNLYKEFGYFKNTLLDFEYEGIEGMMLMKQMMKELRDHAPESIGDMKVDAICDYAVSKCMEGGRTKELTLPKSDVLEYRLSDQSKVIIRPSGTEPKIKIYLSVSDSERQGSEQKVQMLSDAVKKLLKV